MGSRARTVLTTAAAFVLLVAAWELAKLVLPAAGVTFGGVRLLPRTDDAAMPHVWTAGGHGSRNARTSRPAASTTTCRAARTPSSRASSNTRERTAM
ncbi:hypothetical protein WBK50_19265 [Pseudonocardia sp. T1-2H]|uniref:hypothetical protein n=1 Tax=Pseudonocardia sp. T1-2H TaxID=3128899 RepID=UPI00310115B1